MDAMLIGKASLVWSAALVAAFALRRSSAATRHRLWTVAFAAVLALPLLDVALPSIDVAVPAAWGSRAAVRSTALPIELFAKGTAARDSAPDARHSDVDLVVADRGAAALPTGSRGAAMASFTTMLLVIWLIGGAGAAGTLLVSLIRVRRLAAGAEAISSVEWQAAAAQIATRLGVRRRPRLLVSARVSTPMAGGVLSPTIFLPASAAAWSRERRDVVLAHEIAHLAARDPLRHLLVRVAGACYWFHPLAWIAARQAAVAREQACDEAVVALGARRSAYARVLLDLAESMQPSVPPLAALPMVQRSMLEMRLMAILADARPATRLAAIPAIALALLTLSIAAAQPHVAAPTLNVSAMSPASMAPTDVTPVLDALAEAPPRPRAETVSAPIQQPAAARDSACWWDANDRTFRGSVSIGSGGVVREQIGTRGAVGVIQQHVGDLRICMLAEGIGDRGMGDRPSQWPGRAARVIMEAQRGTLVQRLEVTGQGGAPRVSWQVGGADRAFDAAAEQWRERMLALLDTTWELSTLRGQVSSLRGEISSIRGEESSLRGEISSLRGEVSSMRGQQSSIRGEESSLRGEISAIQGHVSSLRGSISAERGAISSLQSRYPFEAADRARIAAHEQEIARLEREIRDYGADAKVAAIERQIAALAADRKVDAIDAEIRAFNVEGKMAGIERRISALEVEGRIAAIERRIAALDADRRGRQLEQRRDEELARLQAAIAAIR